METKTVKINGSIVHTLEEVCAEVEDLRDIGFIAMNIKDKIAFNKEIMETFTTTTVLGESKLVDPKTFDPMFNGISLITDNTIQPGEFKVVMQDTLQEQWNQLQALYFAALGISQTSKSTTEAVSDFVAAAMAVGYIK